jgi:hypothetical protein
LNEFLFILCIFILEDSKTLGDIGTDTVFFPYYYIKDALTFGSFIACFLNELKLEAVWLDISIPLAEFLLLLVFTPLHLPNLG